MAGIKIPITLDNANFTESARAAQMAIRNVSGEVKGLENDTKDATSGIKEMLTQAAAFGGISIGVAGVKEFVTQMVDVRKEMQGYSTALSVLLGNQEQANAMFTELKEFAVTTPLMFKDLAAGAQTMLGFNIEAEKVVPTLKAIGDISMGDAQKFQSLTLAFSQMSATGKLMGQDLLQMINAGFNPLAEISRKTGKSISELKDEMSNGAISADMVADAYMSATREGGKFNGMLEKQGKGIAGQMNTLQGAIDDMFNDLGTQSESIIVGTIQSLTELVKNWENVGAAIVGVTEAFGVYKALEMTNTALDNTATNMAYDAEIKALQTLFPIKEKAVAADLEQAVSSGRLTKAKAEQIAALREEGRAHLEALKAQEAKAKAEFQAATRSHIIAKQNMAIAQSQMQIAIKSGSIEEIAAAKKAASAAKTDMQNAALQRNTAMQALNAAATQRSAAAAAVDAAGQTADAAATNVLTLAKERLAAVMKAVNASFLGSPLFWWAAVIAGVTLAVYKLATAETAEEKARRKSTEAWDDFSSKQDEYKKKVRDLVDKVRSSSVSLLEQYKAFNKLKEIMPELIKEFNTLEGLQNASQDQVDAAINRKDDADKRAKILNDVAEAQEKLNKAREKYEAIRDSSAFSEESKLIFQQEVEDQKAVYEQAVKVRDEFLAEERKALEQAKKEAHIELYVEEAEGNKTRLENAMDLYNRATKSLSGKVVAPNIAPPDIDDILKEIDTKLQEAKAEYEKDPANVSAQLDYESIQKVKNDIINAKEEMERGGITKIPVTFEMQVNSTQEQLNEAVSNYVELLDVQASKNVSKKTTKAVLEQQKKDKEQELADLDEIKAKGEEGARLKKEIEALDKRIQESYGTNNGKDRRNKAKQAKEDAKRLQEVEERISRDEQRAAKDREFEAEQARIDAMDEGHQKVMDQIKLDYDKEKEEIERQREDLKQTRKQNERERWEANNPELVRNDANAWVTTGQEKKFEQEYASKFDDSDLFKKLEDRAEKRRKKRTQDQLDSEKEALNEFLTLYGDYYQQREAIEKTYQDRISKATTEGDKQRLESERLESLENLDIKFGRSGSRLEEIWKDVSKKTRAEINKMISDLKVLQETIKDGNISEEEENILRNLGFNDADIQKVRNGKKSIEEITEKIEDLQTTVKKSGTVFEQLETAWDAIFGENGKMNEENLKALNDAFLGITSTAGQSVSEFQKLADALGNKKMASALQDVGNVLSDIGTGAQIGGVFGGYGALIGAILGAGSGVAKALAGHADDSAIEQQNKIRKSVKRLEQSYDDLSDAVDRTYSKEKQAIIEKEIRNLQQQNNLIQQQIGLEKTKKNSDDNAIEGYQDMMRQNQERIKQLTKDAKDAIFGEELQTAIEDFADAYSDAWASNTNRTKTAKEQVREMMQNMVKESIKASIEASGAMEKIRQKMTDFYKDGVFTAEEQEAIYREATALQKDLDARFGWADDLLDKNKDFTQQATAGGFEKMSQESADELNGRFAAGQMTMEGVLQQTMLIYASGQQMLSISTESNETLKEVRNLLINVASNVEDIAIYTKAIAKDQGVSLSEINRKLDKL